MNRARVATRSGAAALNRALPVRFAGRAFLLDHLGAAFDIESRSLIAADLHLEKAESFARTGQFLPPYDSLATLRRLMVLVDHYAPKRIILLGDSFHRSTSCLPMDGEERRILATLAEGAEIIWISGNHDPDTPEDMPGLSAGSLNLEPILLRHMPDLPPGFTASGVLPLASAEMFGHFHPAARIMTRAGSRRRRCFLVSERRMLLPAFGVLTGGMDVSASQIASLFPEADARAYLLGDASLHAMPLAAVQR